MKTYNVKVGFRGSNDPVVVHEVRRYNVPAAEVLVMQTVHGEQSVTDIQATGETTKVNQRDLRAHLVDLYGETAVKDTFGAAKSAKLPTELELDGDSDDGDDNNETQSGEEPKDGRQEEQEKPKPRRRSAQKTESTPQAEESVQADQQQKQPGDTQEVKDPSKDPFAALRRKKD